MARIRALKPGFFKDSELYDAEKESGLPLRVAYAGLWCVADREGRFKWKPREIKSDVLPHDDVNFENVLNALTKHGFIFKYKCDGCEYGFIPKFSEHQHVNKNEAISTLPAPPKNSNARAKRVSLPDKNSNSPTSTTVAPVSHPVLLTSGVLVSGVQGTGKERNGKEQEGSGEGNQTSLRSPVAVAPLNDLPDLPECLDRRPKKTSSLNGHANDFAIFYENYLIHKARRAAEKAYAAALKRGATVEQILAGAKRYAIEMAGKEPKFIKRPATWLNDDCWLDEPEKKSQTPQESQADLAAKLDAYMERNARALNPDK